MNGQAQATLQGEPGRHGRSNPNPFSAVDHAPFAGWGVDLVWGLDAARAATHIGAAKRRLPCGLICPACKSLLIARKGPKMAVHFSHQGKASGCGSGRETTRTTGPSRCS